jgi:UDPglucose 6-dehydrogenase
MQEKVGIIGQGFVGSAVREGLKEYCNILTYDKYVKELSTEESLENLVEKADVIFLCVPTPMRKSGQCDISVVESVVEEIHAIMEKNFIVSDYIGDGGETTGFGRKKTIVLKSTVPPGTCRYLNEEHFSRGVSLVFNPEFLTEANSFDDFKNQNRIVLGGDSASVNKVEKVFRLAFPYVPVIKTDTTTAEMVKYITNTFLSTKVSFANEIYQICKATGIEYSDAIKIAQFDKRLGMSHWSVPGPDGSFGFGGHCFPKDLQALSSLATELGADTTILDAVWKKNNMVREDRDWEAMKGRAVSED